MSLSAATPTPPRTLYWKTPQNLGLREGDWKLVWQVTLPSKVELFNLAQDPSESNNLAAANPDKDSAQPPKTAVQKTLGLELSNLSDDLRKKYKVRENIKGVIITGVDPGVASSAPDKRLSPGDVIVEVQYQAIGNPAELQSRLDQLKSQGKKVAVLLVSNPDGETRFVALNLQ